jgi:hypothetical protein
MGPDSCQGIPKSVILRGTSSGGPLELKIPIRILEQPGQTIHQLAAKKAIIELEEDRGWISEALTGNGMSVEDRYPGHVEELVHRSAVKLGVQFQVSGEHCSFVATEKRISGAAETDESAKEFEFLDSDIRIKKYSPGAIMSSIGSYVVDFSRDSVVRFSRTRRCPSPHPLRGDGGSSGRGCGVFLGRGSPPPRPGQALASCSAAPFGVSTASRTPPPAPMMKPAAVFNAPEEKSKAAKSRKKSRGRQLLSGARNAEQSVSSADEHDGESYDSYGPSSPETGPTLPPLQALVALQLFEGSWQWKSELLSILGLERKAVETTVPKMDMAVLATALAVRFLETKLADEKDSWELVVEKARQWIEEKVGAQGLKDAFASAEKTLA